MPDEFCLTKSPNLEKFSDHGGEVLVAAPQF
jgi:hypothetical protein